MPAFNVQKATEAGYTPEQISSYLAQRKAQGVNLTVSAPKQQQPVEKPKRSGLTSLLPLLGGIGGSVVGGFGGPAGIIAGGAAGSGIGEFLAQKFSGEKDDIGKVVSEGAMGGVGSVAGLGAGRLLGALTRGAGGELTKGAIRQGVKPGTKNVAKTVDDLAAAEKELGISGSGVAKTEKVGKLRGTFGKQREELLGGVNQPVQKATFKKDLKRLVTEEPELFDEFNTSHKKSLEALLARVDKLPGDQIQPKDVQAFRISLNKLSTRAQNALAKGDTSSVNAKSATAYDMQKAIDKILPGYLPEGVSGKASDLTRKLAQTYQLEPIYADQARKGVSIPILGNIGPLGRPVQALADRGGRLLERAGQPRDVLAATAGQGVGRTLMDQNRAPAAEGEVLPSQGDTLQASLMEQPRGNQVQDLFKVLILQDLAQTGGDNITKLVAASQFLNPEGEQTAEQKKQVTKLKNAENVISSFERQLGSIGLAESGPAARLQGLSSSLGAAIGTDEKAKVYNDLRGGFASNLIRAFGEVGTLTDQDIKRATALIPSLGDSKYEAASKLQEIRTILSQGQQATLGQ